MVPIFFPFQGIVLSATQSMQNKRFINGREETRTCFKDETIWRSNEKVSQDFLFDSKKIRRKLKEVAAEMEILATRNSNSNIFLILKKKSEFLRKVSGQPS